MLGISDAHRAKVQTWALAVLMAVALIGCVYALGPYAHQAPPVDNTKLRPGALEPSAQPTFHATSVVMFGDSYTAGAGATTATAKWVNRLSEATGWDIENVAQGGTGYLHQLTTNASRGCNSSFCPNYDQMLKRVTTGNPDVVIVTAGRNDVGENKADIIQAITKFYRDLRAKFPKTAIYAISPIWDDDAVPAQLQDIRAEVRSAVRSVKGKYIDIGDPLLAHSRLVAADGGHPNDAGHIVIERAVLAGLKNAAAPVG